MYHDIEFRHYKEKIELFNKLSKDLTDTIYCMGVDTYNNLDISKEEVKELSEKVCNLIRVSVDIQRCRSIVEGFIYGKK